MKIRFDLNCCRERNHGDGPRRLVTLKRFLATIIKTDFKSFLAKREKVPVILPLKISKIIKNLEKNPIMTKM